MARPSRSAISLSFGLLAALALPLAVPAQDVAPEVICPEIMLQDTAAVQSTCEPAPEPSYRYAPTLSLEPHHPDYINPSLCEGCFDAVVTYSTPSYTSLDQERNLTLLFANAQARPTGFLQVDATDNSTSDRPTRVSLRVRHPNGSWVTFTNGLQEVFYQSVWGTLRLAAQWDASGMATGAYSYTAVVTSYWADGGSMTSSTPVRVLIVNERNSPLGLGWSIPGVQRLHVQADGAAVIAGGDGSAVRFGRTYCGTDPYTGIYSCSYVQPAGDFSTLTYFDAGGAISYIRTYPNGTRIFFDAAGFQTSVQDRHGNATQFGYTSGRLTSVTDPAGKATTLGYHTYGGLAWIRDPAGRQASATASMGILYRFTDPDGVVGLDMNFEGDRLEGFWPRGQSTSGGAATRWQFTYDHARRLASRTAPTVNVNAQPSRPVIRYASLEAAVLAPVGRGSSSDPAEAVPSSSVRAHVTDPRNSTTRLALDRFGAPTLIEEPLGRTTHLTRNTHSQVTVSVSPSNQRVEYRWSGPNLIRSADLSVNRVDTMAYVDNRLRERSTRTLSGNVYWPAVTYHYRGVYLDSVTVYSGVFGTVSGVPLLQPGGGSRYATYQMDGRGRLTALTDGAGYTTRYYYAPGGWMNIDSVVAPGRRKTSYTYDAYGRARTVTNALGHADTLDYDVMNRIRRVAQPGGLVTRFEYGSVHLTGVTDARNQVYQFTTNALGWTERETDPLGRQEHYRFDANGNVTRWTNRRGQHVDLAYDALNQRSSRTADGVVTQYHSDPQGRFRTAHVPGVSTDTIRFDPRGRPAQQVSVHGGRRHVLTSTYGNSFSDDRTSVSLSAPWSRSVTFMNYSTGQLHELTDAAGGKTTVAYDSRRLATAYTLPTGNTMSVRYPSTSQTAHVSHSHAGLNAAFGVRYQQDVLAQTVSRSNAVGDSLRELTYDVHGQLQGISDYRISTSTGSCEWVWDPDSGEHCQTETTRTLLGQTTYTFDAVGNRTDRGGVVGTGNRLTSVDGYTLTYDDDGNVTRKYWTANPGGFDQRLTWNSLGQLTSATTNGATVTYRYNGWGELVSRSDASGTIRYVYDGDDLFMETVDGWSEPYRVYTNYPGVDHPHSVQVWTPATGSQVYYFATEYPGSVLGLFNASNQIVNRYRYDPWGRSELASEQVSNAIRYAGRYRDWGTGLDYNRHRWYDAHTGRFISQDPLGLAGGVNPYAYAGNAPFDHTDPYGLLRIPAWVPYAAFAVTVGMGVGGGMSVGHALGGTIQAFAATAVGAAAAAGLQSLVTDKSFGAAFRDIYGISTAFLAGGATVAALIGGGPTEIGANGWFQGYVVSSKKIGPRPAALTLGSAAVFGSANRKSPTKFGTLGAHERGHTIQFILLSLTGEPWLPYLGLGIMGRADSGRVGHYTQWWERLASWLGR
jgi:RHS repeat-associated protein